MSQALSCPALCCKDVTVRFGGVTALGGVTMNVAKGDVHAVIGPNGAGKTTLLNAVTGLVSLTEGSVAVGERDLTRLPAHKRAGAGIVRTFQNLEIFGNMRALGNVLVGRHLHTRYTLLEALVKAPRYQGEELRAREAARRKLAFVGLGELAEAKADALAYGQARLLEIARALAAEPEILLLDEPAAGMNMAETRALSELILKIRDELGITVVLVEHDMECVMAVSDRITVLSFGTVLAEGTPEQIRADPQVIQAYLGEEEDADESAGEAREAFL